MTAIAAKKKKPSELSDGEIRRRFDSAAMERFEDAEWQRRAIEAEAEGMLGVEKGEALLRRLRGISEGGSEVV